MSAEKLSDKSWDELAEILEENGCEVSLHPDFFSKEELIQMILELAAK